MMQVVLAAETNFSYRYIKALIIARHMLALNDVHLKLLSLFSCSAEFVNISLRLKQIEAPLTDRKSVV